MAYCEVEDIVTMLMVNAKQYQSELDQMVLGSLNKILKDVENLKAEYLWMDGNLERRLKGDKMKLIDLLSRGPAKELKPSFVAKILDEFGQETENSEEMEEIKKTKEVLERLSKESLKGLEEIRKLWKIEEGRN